MPALKLPVGLALQERDFEILRGLFDSRVLTLSHIARLYFEGRDEAAKKRVQKLKSAGFITERPRRAYEPSVLHLTRKAFQLLEQHGHLSEFPKLSLAALERRAQVSELTIRHELDVQEVKATLTAAIQRKEGFEVTDFLTWPVLYEFEVNDNGFGGRNIAVKPDAFIRIVECDANGESFERMFFLEVDRSTESQEVIGKKASSYRQYFRSGKFAEWRGGRREEVDQFPFRVLWVFKTAARRDNAARSMLALNPPILKQAWLTTLDGIKSDPLAGWKTPQEYLSVNTSFSNLLLY